MSTRKNGLFIIENKVIGQKEVQELADLIWKEYQPRHLTAKNNIFKSYVKCFERVSYENDGINIFNADSEIYKERIKTIEITAQCDKLLYIKLRLNHGQVKVDDKYISDSDIEIGGDDFVKIHDIHARVLQYIKSIPEQHNYFVKNDKVFSWIILFLGTIAFGFAIDFVSDKSNDFTPYWRSALSDIGNFIGYVFLAVIIGGFIAYSIYDSFVKKSRDLWPTVELRIGPEHFRTEVKYKNYLIQFWILFMLPLIIAVVYDLFKTIIYSLK